MVHVVAGIVLFVIVGYFILLMPRLGGRRASFFVGKNIAHRGLFNNQNGIPENSMAAFALAVQAGFGIELDLQLSADGQPVVFHDQSLYRMTGISADLCHLTYQDLSSLRLLDTKERIPTLNWVLGLVDGMVPLLIELKSVDDDRLDQALCFRVAQVLDDYRGAFAIESFDPKIVRWFRQNRPHYVRGQLAVFSRNSHFSFIRRLGCGLLVTNIYTRPDFIAYAHKQGGLFPLQVCKHIWRTVTIGWTIKNMDEYKAANRIFDGLVFEQIMPSTSFVKGKLTPPVVMPSAVAPAAKNTEIDGKNA